MSDIDKGFEEDTLEDIGDGLNQNSQNKANAKNNSPLENVSDSISSQDGEKEQNKRTVDDLYDSESSLEKKGLPVGWKVVNPLIKIFIILPGKIMRIFLEIGDLYYFMQILNITIDFLVILLVSTFRINKYAAYIITFLYSFLTGNLLSVPAWELFQLRWIKNKNPFETIFNILDLRRFCKDYDNKTVYTMAKITNFAAGIFFYFYAWAVIDFMGSKGNVFDIMNLIVLLIIPGIKFFFIYIPLISRLLSNLSNCKSKDKSSDEDESKTEIRLQKCENVRDPFLLAQISTKNFFKKPKQVIFFALKSAIILMEFIVLIIVYVENKINAVGVVFSLFIFIYIAMFSELISMPIWILNLFHRWDCKCIGATTGPNEKIRLNPLFNGFKYVGLFFQILPIVVIGLLIAMEIGRKKDTYFYKITNDVKWDGQMSNNYPYIPPISTVKSSMCFTRIYNLSLIQIASIAAAPYYEDIKTYQDLISKSFFKDANWKINLAFKKQLDDHPVLLQADFDDYEQDNHVTIFSVRGSRTPTDWWLDVEMFVSSAMLTIAKWIPFLQRQEGKTHQFISAFMTLPLTLMAEATYTYKYIDEMEPFIDDFIKDRSNANRNILFTGHSLGGGLSKVLAHKYQYQSVAVSGPGISPIERYVENKKNDNDKYFKSKLVDIVPDRDLVPRFESSGGTKYRVLCNQNVGECHSKLRTVCQMGISCDDEYHVGDFCSHAFTEEKYKEMKKLAHR